MQVENNHTNLGSHIWWLVSVCATSLFLWFWPHELGLGAKKTQKNWERKQSCVYMGHYWANTCIYIYIYLKKLTNERRKQSYKLRLSHLVARQLHHLPLPVVGHSKRTNGGRKQSYKLRFSHLVACQLHHLSLPVIGHSKLSNGSRKQSYKLRLSHLVACQLHHLSLPVIGHSKLSNGSRKQSYKLRFSHLVACLRLRH